ncbi:hypothetical protein B296_00022705 [Ensete ventricosum]|uniref:Uncharacterized protein n=1 Tax=Ensete ventricosum TaxID=4639 RepID=A0A426XNU9_ENSVE|nr:hypothetical protein B296_00022705 [Ensete ventricosum]
MRWDIAGSSLGDSPKESRSLLGTRREIAKKKTGGLVVRLPEVAGVYRMSGNWIARTTKFKRRPAGVDG